MTAGGPTHIVHPELVEFYNNYEGSKCRYSCFFARVLRKNIPKSEAIKPQTLKGKSLIKGHVDNEGRECNQCKKYKPRDEYNNNKVGIHFKDPICRDCKNANHRRYRQKTNSIKDKENKVKKRKLEIGQKIAFYDPIYVNGYPREDVRIVVEYKFKRGYKIQSIHSKEYKRLDTNDNYGKNNNCLKFYKLES